MRLEEVGVVGRGRMGTKSGFMGGACEMKGGRGKKGDDGEKRKDQTGVK